MFYEIPPDTPSRRHNDAITSSDYNHNNSINNINNNTLIINNNMKLTPQNSLTMHENPPLVTSSSFLSPPTLYSRERRLSASSVDSSVSQGSKRRLRRNSSSRLSDFDDDKSDITLMTFARGAQKVYYKFGKCLRRAVGTLFVTRPRKPNIVCEAGVMEQAEFICRDYIISKLSSRDLMSRKVGLSLSTWQKSVYVINAGAVLELTYPRTYSNVSRKLCMTMSSPKIVRSTLTLLLDVLFEGNVTWGKVVSMFAVAGLFAEECASQGHADFVKDVVDAVVDFIGAHLLTWLCSQGGWEAFPLPGAGSRSRLSKLRLAILASGTAGIAASVSKFFDLW